jgi:hypothetical protein
MHQRTETVALRAVKFEGPEIQPFWFEQAGYSSTAEVTCPARNVAPADDNGIAYQL